MKKKRANNQPSRNKANAKEIVKEWRKEHPHGHPSELYNTGLVSRSSVDRYWDSCGEGDRPFSAADKVAIWRSENPNGSQVACAKETGLSRRIVIMRWNPASAKKDKEIEIKKDKNGQLFFDL